jgi:hypothetical protein
LYFSKETCFVHNTLCSLKTKTIEMGGIGQEEEKEECDGKKRKRRGI